ncbi:hypothetical protein [Nonomuraea sp. NPDC046570]|uniref:hypothetical protein n=1 Tax=Nonomuraea sp. NPDC046570 TaxID=3155255 RepID=UPI0033FCAD10
MNQTRKMWVSAGVVGVILVGGATIAASASAGRLEKVSEEMRAVVEKNPPLREPAPSADPESVTPSDDDVVSHEVEDDPGKVTEYWTDDRMEHAEPMPIPEVDAREGEKLN